MSWSRENVPPLEGKVALITGANSGLGFESAEVLAARGARVILACRTHEKAEQAAREIAARHPSAALEPLALDLASLSSVRSAASAVAERHAALDLLINNAGVMATPQRQTADGFELQFGTNHLGHFALTGLLFERLLRAPAARVVTVSSSAHHLGKMRFDDPHGRHAYHPWRAYGMSKLANLLFSYELARRIEARALPVRSVAAHPGYAATNLQYRGLELAGSALAARVARLLNPWFGQPAARGALPELYAATAADVENGDYIGPDGLFEARGHPRKVRSSARSRDVAAMERLWSLSESWTGVRFPA